MALNAPAHSYSREPDIRLEDYLDDKLQSTTDFESLDNLLASVEIQRNQLQTQLDDATKELQDARRAAEDRQGGLAKSIDEFYQLQESIDVRMKIVAESTAPDEAIRRLEQPMKQLHKVELAYQYVSLLQDVENLRLEARSHLPQNPKAALQSYSRLKKLSIRLRELQRAADEAATHLVNYVEKITEELWQEMKNTMSAELENILKKRDWPQGVDTNAEMDGEWLQCFEKLVDLQVPEILYSEGIVTLLPIEVMAKPFVQWFQFQFMGNNATSNPHAFGTFCIPQFIALIDKWEGFFRDNMGYILSSRFLKTKVGGLSVYLDPACALITALLPVMREKVNAMVQHGLQNPQFLSSLIVQLMDLDDEIRSRFNYDGGDPEKGWAGLTSEVLEKHFDDWFKAEKDFALERYHVIMNSLDARNIDYDYSGVGKMKPTFGAVRVTDLLRSVTSQYERVRRFSHKLRFLIDIQLEILDDYHDRFKDSLDTYYTINSTLGRTLHGLTKEQAAALEGTGAFETLCKVLGSSDHIIATLKDWSNEEFFVTLWDQLQTRAKRSHGDGDIASGMSYEDVKDKTSSVVGSDGDGGILFDETISAYTHRRKAAEEYLVSALNDSHQKAFRPYFTKAHWTTISDNTHVEASQLSLTPELDEPLKILKRNLAFLSTALSTAVYRRIWRESLEKLQDLLWTNVLMTQNFTTLGAAQFVRDLDAITSLITRHIPDGSAAFSTLQDGLQLLNLPLEAKDGGVSLQQASDLVFTDNTEAKKLLSELGLESLTPANARKILQRRVENSE
ncbi:TIP-1 family-domain-containing protein [Annulohypoxylon maeteangense]|uniref:TIP-1 family-domain-containing protein n=1 Tax=Annulohypoxylon maeteangense TaxID=1927788 RepID=UPI002007C4C1|nr:TIP-1 family-domain-containing protein [Annulohypoxylon maeteangense]KAI0886545.1 TIP-1 family-domain-containing protein [Annulohypoxylon maeteangense]